MQVYAERYDVIKDLGKGAAGKVVLVKDKKTGFLCALKLVQVSFGRSISEALKDFTSEFDILKNLNHPSIAKVYDLGVDREINRFYITTEFVDGKDLFASTENLTVDEIEKLFIQSLRALNYLHSQKTFHFDIKPQNVLVTKDENGNPCVKLIDFGFANFFERQKKGGAGESFAIVGTGAYVPPEIILGESHDGRADLYSLACTFYKAFTRELAFSGKTDQEVHEQHLTMRHKDLTEHRKEVPEYLNRVFAKLLEKKPEDRYSTAQEVIEELNMLSGKNYPIETSETIVSYLPEKGNLIAREAELKTFNDFFEDRIFLEMFKHKNYLVIVGDEGFGKTRLLQECKAQAQKHFTPIMTWAEAKKISLDQMPKPYLVLGDDVLITKDELVYVEVAFEKDPILFVFTTTQHDLICDHDSIIELKPFTKEQTREFLVRATGFKNLSDNIFNIIYKNTRGLPQYLTEYVRVLFERGFFKSSHGSWSEEVLIDLGDELERVGVLDFIKKRQAEKLKDANISDGQKEILAMMALTGKPTLADLSEMTGGADIDDQIEDLVKKGFLETDPEQRYTFSNIALKNIILEQMPLAQKAEYCDTIANVLEGQGDEEEKILYYRGRGSSVSAANELLKLARIQRRQMNFQNAKENLLELVGKKSISDDLRVEAYLELGEVCTEVGLCDEGAKWFRQIVEHAGTPAILLARAYQKLGMYFRLKADFVKAKENFEKGLATIAHDEAFKWRRIVFKGHLVRAEYDLGNFDRSLADAGLVWSEWQRELSENDKIAALDIEIETVYFLSGKHEKAAEVLQEKYDLIKNKKELEIYPLVIYNLGCTCLRLNRMEEGEKLLLECLKILKERKKTHALYAVYNELGRFYGLQGKDEESFIHFKHAFDLARIKALGLELYVIAYNLANNRARLSKWDEAERYYNFVMKNFGRINVKEDTIVNYHLFLSAFGLSEVYRQKNQKEKVLEHIKKAESLLREKEFLKSYAQFYLQEKADACVFLGDVEGEQQALSELKMLEKENGFDAKAFKKWFEQRTA